MSLINQFTRVQQKKRGAANQSSHPSFSRHTGLAMIPPVFQLTASNPDSQSEPDKKEAEKPKDSSATETKTGHGENGLTSTAKHEVTHTDSSGNSAKRTHEGTLGITAGPKGIGANASSKTSREYTSKDGIKPGLQTGLSARIHCNVDPIPGTLPRKYRFILEVNLGGEIGVSLGAGKEKEPQFNASLKVGKSLVLRYTKDMDASETKTYLANLRGSGAGGGSKIMSIIHILKTQGWRQARLFYLQMKEGMTSEKMMDAMKDGESMEEVDSTTLGGVLGGKGSGTTPIGGKIGKERTWKDGMKVEKKGDQFIFTPDKGTEDVDSAEVSMVLGEKGPTIALGSKNVVVDQTSYKIVLNRKDKNFHTKLKELRACKTSEDYQKFVEKYPDSWQSKTRTTGSSGESSLGVGAEGTNATITSGSGFTQSVETDRDGKLIKETVKGHNKGAVSTPIPLGPLPMKGSSTSARTETATGTIDSEGRATLDVNQVDSKTNIKKVIRNQVPFADPTRKVGEADRFSLAGLAELATGAKKAGATEDEIKSGVKIANKELQILANMAKDEGQWRKACPSTNNLPDWLKARQQILNGGCTPAAVARALARFVSGNKDKSLMNHPIVKKVFDNPLIKYNPDGRALKALGDFISNATSPDRDDVIRRALRSSPDDVGLGLFYQWPEELKHLEPLFNKVVFQFDPSQLKTMAQSIPNGDAATLGQDFMKGLGRLEKNLKHQAHLFSDKAAHAEMMNAILNKQNQLRKELGKITGETSEDKPVDQYNRLLDSCITHKHSESALFTEIQTILNDTYVGQGKAMDKAKVLKQIKVLYALWMPQYKEMAQLAEEHGFGKDRYWKYKPDKARLNRALKGDPGGASEMKPEPPGKYAKKAPVKRASSNPVGEGFKNLAKVKKKQALSTAARLNGARSMAEGNGNRLHAWIHKDRKVQAVNAHIRGMEFLNNAKHELSLMPANPTDDDWNAYGDKAVYYFMKARSEFRKGLTLYPPGKPK